MTNKTEKAPYSMSEFITDASRNYLNSVDWSSPPPLRRMAAGLLNEIAEMIDGHNSVCAREWKWKIPDTLQPAQIADLLLATHRIANISPTNGRNGNCLLAIYREDGPDMGTYSTDSQNIRELARECNCLIKSRELDEVMLVLRDRAPCITECSDRDLVPVNNGIFNYSVVRQIKRRLTRHVKSELIHMCSRCAVELSSVIPSDYQRKKLPMQIKTQAVS